MKSRNVNGSTYLYIRIRVLQIVLCNIITRIQNTPLKKERKFLSLFLLF